MNQGDKLTMRRQSVAMATAEMPTLKNSELAIVLLGNFNPVIFQPAWFSAQGLIPTAEADLTKQPDSLLVHPDLTFFRLPWVEVRVTKDRFQAGKTSNGNIELLRDLVVGTFLLLSHTPIRGLGINLEQHYSFPTTEAWNAFGHKLAPKTIWNQKMKDPGLVKMEMMDKVARETPPKRTTRITIESSRGMTNAVSFQVNQHFEWPQELANADTAIKVVKSEISSAVADSTDLINSLL